MCEHRCCVGYPRGGCAFAFVDAHPCGANLSEVGDALGVCRERIRQIEVQALRNFARAARRMGLDLAAPFAAAPGWPAQETPEDE